MRRIEHQDTTVPSPIEMNEEVVSGILEMLGKRVAFHHTIQRSDWHNMTYGDLHEAEQGAENARAGLVRNERMVTYGKAIRKDDIPTLRQKAVEGWQNAPIIELAIGQEYHEWGSSHFKHGIDDGTHGSKRK